MERVEGVESMAGMEARGRGPHGVESPVAEKPGHDSRGLSPLSGRPGGKFYLARELVARMPGHFCYCEPFCGAAWLLFRKERSRAECLNDIDRDIVNFFETVRTRPEALYARAAWAFHSRELFQRYAEEPLPSWEEDPVERAWRLYYLSRAAYRATFYRDGASSFISGSQSNGKFSRSYFYRQLESAFARLEGVILECRDWRDVLGIYDGPETFFYLDPPYPGTRFDYGKP